MDYICYYNSPLGRITMACEKDELTGLWFDGQAHFAETLSADHEYGRQPVFAETARWLDLYFGGGIPDFTPPLQLRTTAFRKAVWSVLLTVPYGRTITYGEIAGRLAGEAGTARVSARAVGNAVGHNAVSLIIPCHRVIGSGGNLAGYAGGLERKKFLLRLEHIRIKGED